jgi:hypothetical protein
VEFVSGDDFDALESEQAMSVILMMRVMMTLVKSAQVEMTCQRNYTPTQIV